MGTNVWKMFRVVTVTTFLSIACAPSTVEISAAPIQTKTQKLALSIDNHLIESFVNKTQSQRQEKYQWLSSQQPNHPHAIPYGTSIGDSISTKSPIRRSYSGTIFDGLRNSAAGDSAVAASDLNTSSKQHIPVLEYSHDNDYAATAAAAAAVDGTSDSSHDASSNPHVHSNANMHLTGTYNGYLPTPGGYSQSQIVSATHQQQQQYPQHYALQQPHEKLFNDDLLYKNGHNSGYNEIERKQQQLYEQHQNSYWHLQQPSYPSEQDAQSFEQQHYHHQQPTANDYDENNSNYRPSEHEVQQHPPPDVINYIPYPVVKKLHVPIHEPVKIPVSHAVILPISKPVPIHIPVTQQVQIPVEKELKIPVERVVPYPVEKHVPVPIEKRVPFPVVKYVPVKIPQPFPVKVPVFKTILHKVKSLW